MKKSVLIVSIAVTLVVAIFLLMLVGNKRKQNPTAIAKQEETMKGSHELIVLAQQYEKDGKYLESKAAYWKAMEESSDSNIIKEAEKKLYDLNMKLLFSPIINEDSLNYTVVKGDSLTKIAKKFNTTIELLMKSNHLSSDLIRPGMELKVSAAKYSIMVDRSQNLLILKSNDEILKIYKVSTGKDQSTPLGTFAVINKLVDPTWFPPGAIVPPGDPKNILGSRWIGISKKEYGIHGTTEPETVGMHVTAGCVRMFNEEVEELYTIIPVGTEVTIIN